MVISRRFGGTLLLGAAIALAALATASAQPQERAKQGGTLVVGLGFGEPDALDPSTIKLFSSLEVLRTICQRLYDSNSKAQVVPELAASMPVISKDRRTYTFTLRRGVVFNDGTTFDAQSVVMSLQRDMTLPTSVWASDLSSIDSVSARGRYTVVIHLKAPYDPLLDTLDGPAGIVMSPAQLAKLGANFGSDPICVGPFMFDNRVAGDSVTVVKSPYYFKKKDVHLDRIVFKVENDAAAATAALKAGDLQALDTISPSNLPFLQSDPSVRLFHRTQFGFQSITFNIGNKNGVGKLPYQNVGTPLATRASLRKAFDEAIDRKTTGRVVLDGEMVPGCTAVSPVSAWFDPTVTCPRFDQADAKRLVRASGLRNPTVHLLTSNLTDDLRLAEAIQAQEEAVGFNVVIDSGDKATVQARAAAGNFDAFVGPAWTGSFNADGNVYKFVATSGSRNWSGYSNPQLDRLLDQARQAPTMKAAKALYHQAETIIVNDRPTIYLYHAIKYAGVSTHVTGVQFDPGIAIRVAFAQFK